ncbi:MAG: putative NADH-flavin reductase [Bermanella sp.]|jgi:putative NADH-flavin reductase
MNLVLFGATGALGGECLRQAVAAGHQVTVLVRDAAKLPADILSSITVKSGDALNSSAVSECIGTDVDAVLFAVGVVKNSPHNLCTDITANILEVMRTKGVKRFVWCGGGSTLVSEDVVGFGEKFVSGFSSLFMKKKHYDKEAQYQLLDSNRDIQWCGVRPLQMKKGAHSKQYRLGFNRFSGASSISFADCADAMLTMLSDDNWIGKAPIVQY